MALQKWSQAEVIFSPTSTTKLCILDGADPSNKLISATNLFTYYLENNFVLTKEMVEAVLTGDIGSHTHSQYLTAITKEMVEAVLVGVISTHTHDISDIINGVSQADLAAHASDSSHLTLSERAFLDDLMSSGCFNSSNCAVLSLLSVDGSGDLVVGTNLIVEGSISAYNLGDPSITNYDMLTDWGSYLTTMTDWVVAAPLLYDMYLDVLTNTTDILTKVDNTTQVLPGLGISGGGALSSDVTITLDINNLTTDSAIATDSIAFYRSGSHYNSLISDLPFSPITRNIYTPLYTNPSATSGGGLTGGGTLENDLYLEIDINSMEVHSGITEPTLDFMVLYDASTTSHKKISISDLPSITTWGDIIGSITDQIDLITLIEDYQIVNIIDGDGIEVSGPTAGNDWTVTLSIGSLNTTAIAATDYVPFWRTGNDQYRATVSDLTTLLSAYQGWNFKSVDSSDTQIGTYLIAESADAVLKEGANVTLSQSNGVITISAGTTGTTYLDGTGLTLAGSTFNHTNSVSAQTTEALYPITIDTEGHIASYGAAISNLPNQYTFTLKFDTGIIENTDLYTYDGSINKILDIQSGNAILLGKNANIVTINHGDTSSISDITAIANTFISGITFDTYGHILTVDTDSVDFSSLHKFLYVATSTDTGFTWGAVNTNIVQEAESVTDTFTLVNGTKINLYNSTSPSTDSIKIEHAATSRTNNTSAESPAAGATFTAIDSITTDSTGHLTAINTKTVTLPALSVPTLQLSDLSDVNTSTPTEGNILIADGVDWESRPLTEADISDLGSYITSADITYENLFNNGDVGIGSTQIAAGDHSHTASEIITDVTNFDSNLSSADDTVQKALETLDEIIAGTGLWTASSYGIYYSSRIGVGKTAADQYYAIDAQGDFHGLRIVAGGAGNAVGVTATVDGGELNSKAVYGLNSSSTTSAHYGGYFTSNNGSNGYGIYANGSGTGVYALTSNVGGAAINAVNTGGTGASNAGVFTSSTSSTSIALRAIGNTAIYAEGKLTATSEVNFTDYGSGTHTGTAAKWLAVTAAGEVIEEDAPTGGSSLWSEDGGGLYYNSGTIDVGSGGTSSQYAIRGASSSGTAIFGNYSGSTGNYYGIRGQSASSGGAAVAGVNYSSGKGLSAYSSSGVGVDSSGGTVDFDATGTGIIQLKEGSGTAPDSGYGTIYAKTDGKLYFQNDSLTEYDLTASASGGASELSDLNDVNTSTATNRNILIADGADWESRALTEADISDLGSYAEQLSDLSDVNTSTATNKNVLVADGTDWESRALTAADSTCDTTNFNGNLSSSDTTVQAALETIDNLSIGSGGGDVYKSGTPVDNQLAIWTDSDTIEGDSNLTWNGSTLNLDGNLHMYDGNNYIHFGEMSSSLIPTVSISTGILFMDSADDHIKFKNGYSTFDLTLGGSISDIDDLDDVPTPTANYYLKRNSTNTACEWVTAPTGGTTYTEGEGINIVGTVISGENATGINKGVASFGINNFSVTSGAVAIATGGVWAGNLNTNVISGQTNLASGLVATDELLVSDGGVLKKMDVSVLEDYMQNNLSFTGGGINFEVSGQVPYTNETTDDFSYDSDFVYDGSDLIVNHLNVSTIKEPGGVSSIYFYNTHTELRRPLKNYSFTSATSHSDGIQYYDSTDDKLYLSVNSTWLDLTSLSMPFRSTTSSSTLGSEDYTVLYTSSTGTGITVTFPSASSNTGRIYIIVNNSSNSLTSSSYTPIGSGGSITTIAGETSITIQSNGSYWFQIK